MTIQRIIELLEIEHECILRNSHDDCDRNCADCDLVQDDEELHEMYTDVITLLKEQGAVEPKWTSVKERYPEEEGFYLVSADHGNYHPWIAEMRIFMGIKGFCSEATMPCVGAWMPLPEPYKEGR